MRIGGFSEFSSSHREIRETRERKLEDGLASFRANLEREMQLPELTESEFEARKARLNESIIARLRGDTPAVHTEIPAPPISTERAMSVYDSIMEIDPSEVERASEIYHGREIPMVERPISLAKRPVFDEIKEIKSPEYGLPYFPPKDEAVTVSEALRAQVSPQIKEFNPDEIIKEAAKRTADTKKAEKAADICQAAYNAPFEAKLAHKSAAESAEVFIEDLNRKAAQRTAETLAAQRHAELSQMAYNAPFEARLAHKSAEESAFVIEQTLKKRTAEEAARRTAEIQQSARTAELSQMAYSAPFKAGHISNPADKSAQAFIDILKKQAVEEAEKRASEAQDAKMMAEISQAAYNLPFESKLANKSAAESAEVFINKFENEAKRNKKIALTAGIIFGAAGVAAGVVHHIKKSKENEKS